MIRVVITEDHKALIDGIKSFFGNSKIIHVVDSATNGRELLEVLKYKRKLMPHVVITDIRMPIMDGISATREIKKLYPKVNVLAFTMFDTHETVQRMLNAGAHGYILKNSGLMIMIEAIKAVAKGKSYFDPNILVKLEENRRKIKRMQPEKGVLSRREMEILELIAQNKTSNEISEILNIAYNTVKTHRRNMHKKLGLESRIDLLDYAKEHFFKF